MFQRSLIRLGRAVACVAVTMVWTTGASAASDSDRVLEKIAALEARIAALETKNREYKRDAEVATAQARAATDPSSFRTPLSQVRL
jgi:outer membrane immunogenic protein